jgi:hypothetical protein
MPIQAAGFAATGQAGCGTERGTVANRCRGQAAAAQLNWRFSSSLP